MKGHIRQRSKGSWEIALDIGRDPSTGKRRQYFGTVRGTKKDAERRLAELLVSVDQGSYINSKRVNLDEYLRQWLDGYVKTNCSTRTLDGYESIMKRHLIPSLGMIPLSQLEPRHIQQYYARALSEGRADGKGGLSGQSVLHIHRVLFQALNYAVRQGLLVRNIAELVDPPRSRKSKMKTLTPQEVARLLGVAKDTAYYPIIYAAVNTGLREAELLGLCWRDLNLDLASLSISQVLYKRRGICQFKEPKSEHSRRRLDISPSLALFLREYKVGREADHLLLGKPLREDALVFSNISNVPTDPGTLTHNFARIARRVGLHGVRFHDLRHTFATLMLLAGVHPKIVSEMLVHSSIAFTLDVYSHVVGGWQKAAMKQLDEVLKPERTENQDVGKMSADGGETYGASGRIRTDDQRFTKPLLYP